MKPEIDVARLCKAAYRSCMSLARCRENVNYMVRQYVGDNYAEDGAELRLPLNLVSLYHRIVLPKLVADNPRFSLATWRNEARNTVSTMEDVGNEAMKRMRLGSVLERCASSALFNSGWIKVGLGKSEDVGRYAWKLDKGHVFAANVALDDICFDIHARNVDELSFIGNRFRAPLWRIKDDPRFGKRRKDLTPTEDRVYSEMGVEKTSMILRGYYGQDNDLWDMIELWEFFIPETGMTVVVTADDLMDGATEPLVEEEWIGPKGGSPFHMCGFGPVPENLLPKAPIPDLFTLHEDVNNLLRKLIMQGRDQKKVLPIMPGSEGDGKRLQDTNNGETFECAQPDRLKELNFGGPDQANFQLMMQLKELTDWIAGNISAVGGLAPQAKTATQEKLISETSSATVADMQRRMVDFATAVGEHIYWLLWNDPYTAHWQPLEIEGVSDFAIPRVVLPEERRKIPFEDLRLTIVPYSLLRQTPGEVNAQLTQLVTQELGPILPFLAQQGVMLNGQEYLQLKAKLLNRPELLRILTMQAPMQDGPAGQMNTRMPAQTERNYVRTSRSERTPQGESNARVAAMMATMSEGE